MIDIKVLTEVEAQLVAEAAERVRIGDNSHVMQTRVLLPFWDKSTLIKPCLVLAEVFGVRDAISSALLLGFDAGVRYGETMALKSMIEGK